MSFNTTTTTPITTKSLTNGLYGINITGSRISCGFDGYRNTSGRHEGIDFAKGIGSSIYSLTDGVITGLVYGYRGRAGLSTIAIYDSKTNKTVIYLHAAPVSGLYVGKRISRGTKLQLKTGETVQLLVLHIHMWKSVLVSLLEPQKA